jgi:sodium/hydrogen antiporter
MSVTVWFVVVGVLLLAMGTSVGVVRRLPLTSALIYMGVGVLLGPAGLSRAAPDPVEEAGILERITEVAVLISLFTAGLKLRAPWNDRRWSTPLRLATLSMVLTVGMVAAIGVYILHLSLGAAVLLGAVLAPTDPVLASDVQVESVEDRDRLRFALTGEAGLNDGTAFPFIMLGLGLLGLHDLGQALWRWIAVDLVWAAAAGIGSGWLLGSSVGRIVLWLRRERREAVGADDLLALGLIALAYGAAVIVGGYGFLAVFAAGVALRRVETRATAAAAAGGFDENPLHASPAIVLHAMAGQTTEIAVGTHTAPAYMVKAALGFTEQLERVSEVVIVLLVGGLLANRGLSRDALWLVPLLFLVVRPLAVVLGVRLRGAPRMQQRLTMWFGIRGIGSIYYLAYAIAHGLPRDLAERLTGITLTVIACSIVVHGVSVTPLMRHYERRAARRSRAVPVQRDA